MTGHKRRWPVPLGGGAKCSIRAGILKSPFAHGEIFAKAFIEGAFGVHEEVVEAGAARGGAEGFNMGIDLAAILVAGVLGGDFERSVRVFHIYQHDGLAELGLKLLGIEDVEKEIGRASCRERM